jgi:hypothetical protein
MTKFLHPIQSMRRCPDRFSVGAAFLGSLWAYSEGMRVVGGRLYVIDAAISFFTVLFYALIEARVGGSVALFVSISLFTVGRIAIGLKAPGYLREHLISLGYQPRP